MAYAHIIHPRTGNRVSLVGADGSHILKTYIQHYLQLHTPKHQYGGVFEQVISKVSTKFQSMNFDAVKRKALRKLFKFFQVGLVTARFRDCTVVLIKQYKKKPIFSLKQYKKVNRRAGSLKDVVDVDTFYHKFFKYTVKKTLERIHKTISRDCKPDEYFNKILDGKHGSEVASDFFQKHEVGTICYNNGCFTKDLKDTPNTPNSEWNVEVSPFVFSFKNTEPATPAEILTDAIVTVDNDNDLYQKLLIPIPKNNEALKNKLHIKFGESVEFIQVKPSEWVYTLHF